MPQFQSNRDQALDQLTAEFPSVPARILAVVLLGYLDRVETLTAATAATRERIADACLV